MRRHLLIAVAALLVFPSFLFSIEEVPTYSEVRVWPAGEAEIVALMSAGIALDHVSSDEQGSFDVVVNETELALLPGLVSRFEVRVPDLAKEYNSRPAMSPSALQTLEREMKNEYRIQGFEFGSMGGFYTFAEVVRELDSMRTVYPNLITAKESVGSSIQGRSLWMVKISDNADIDEDEQEAFFTGLHHAREPQSMTCLIYFMYHLLENYGTDPEVTSLVDSRELYFIPVANPDGYVYNEQTNPNGGGFWRKNRRVNAGGSFGVDLNRNYGYQWGYDNIGSSNIPSSETYRGTAAFSEPETAAIRDFVEGHNFVSALNFHSYGDYLIYPYGYVNNLLTPDAALFTGMAMDMTQFNGYNYGTANQTVGYRVNGEANDWLYGEQTTKPKVLGMTPEVGNGSDGFWPNQNRIFPLAEENLYPNFQIAWGPSSLFTVDLTLSSSSGSGAFMFTMTATNGAANAQTVRLKVEITGPDGFSAVAFDRTRRLPPSGTFSRTRQYNLRNNDVGLYTVTFSVTEDSGYFPLGTVSQTYDKTSLIAGVEQIAAEGTYRTSLPLENYPNPFNPSTTIRYGLENSGLVSVKVYNLLGQSLRTLVDEFQDAGEAAVVWDGRNDEGNPVPSGMYLVRLSTGQRIETRRIVLLK